MADFIFYNPGDLTCADVLIRLRSTSPGDPEKEFVPSYNFDIFDRRDRTRVGRLGFRVGDTEHIRMYVGHIGYGVLFNHRGNGYAAKACMALRPFIRTYYDMVIITCNPENIPSVKTIEKLGGVYIETVDVPADNPIYARGDWRKHRYEWIIS